ncbi:DUF551 domain-containing protein [Enterobacter hormaechei]|uniref:DUF551 domain-containing protein n=1 Tax=Enterobacter hormaechei TaxID=158836 RepID=UPI003AAF3BD2
MITLTKEWLLTTIAELEEERDAVPGVVNVDAAMALAAMKLARASLEAEIHSYTFEDDPRPLYTAPPAPEVYNIGYATMRHIFTPAGITDVSDMQAVFDQIETVLAGMWQPAPVSVPDALPENDDEEGNDIDYMEPSEVYIFGRTAGWNACRAAMLQGAEPVTTAYKLPANTPCKEAPEYIWLQTAGVWPENGEFSELTWCSDNQHQDDTLYVRADVVTGNSPVIADGWVQVPEEPTHEMLEAGDEQFGTYDMYRRMIAAAPQQEVKP